MQTLKEKLDSDPKPNYLQYTLDVLTSGMHAPDAFKLIKDHMESKYNLEPVNHVTIGVAYNWDGNGEYVPYQTTPMYSKERESK